MAHCAPAQGVAKLWLTLLDAEDSPVKIIEPVEESHRSRSTMPLAQVPTLAEGRCTPVTIVQVNRGVVGRVGERRGFNLAAPALALTTYALLSAAAVVPEAA